MSTFLGFESFLIPLGSTVKDIQDTFRTSLTSYNWQCLRQSITPAATLGNLGTVANAFALDFGLSTANTPTALPLWLGCQMTNTFTPTIMYVQTGATSTYAPSNFTLDWSDNGSSWTTHATFTSEANWGTRETRIYNITSAPAKNYWRINVTAKNGGSYVEIGEWILEDASKNWITNKNFIDIMPPVTETIGNSLTKEEIRMTFTTTAITLRPIQELLTALPQGYVFDTPTAGAVTSSITINGVTISYAGSAGNTEVQNARGLYEAIKNSSDSNFVAWDWYWWNTLSTTVGAAPIACFRKTPSSNIAITATNITARMKSSYCAPMIQMGAIASDTNLQLTTDLINGFIYYLQVNARGLALAVKTNAGFTGPIHACYGDNTSAISQLPVSDIPNIPCSPIELIIGYDDTVNNTGAFGRLSHWWAVPTTYSYSGYGQQDGDAAYQSTHAFTRHSVSGQISDVTSGHTSGTPFGSQWATMRSEGIYSGTDSGGIYPVHRMACDPDNIWTAVLGAGYYGRGVGAVFNSLDWYRYIGTLADEQLVFAQSGDFVTDLIETAGPTDVTLTVTSTTGFPTAGYLFIDNEVIQYTGITSTTFTGCTRGKYATTAATLFSGTPVNIGCWLTKIGTGLLFSGFSKPS